MNKKISLAGLTLLEIVVVLVIMATGAALAIPRIQEGVAQRRADSAIETLRSMSHCIRMYRLEQEVPPPTLAALEVTTGNGCLDSNQYEKRYNYFYAVSGANATLSAKDRQSDRGILFPNAGALLRCIGNSTTNCIQEGKCNSGTTCASLAEVYRAIDE